MGIVRRSFVAVWPLRLGAIVVGLGPGRVLLVARLGVVPPSRAAGGCWGRGVAGLREADVLRQRRRLRALEQRREPRDQRGAGDRSGGEPGDVRPADPSAASHLRFRTPDAGAAPPGRYSRPPLWPSPSTSEYELVLMLDPEIPDERRERDRRRDATADRVRRRRSSTTPRGGCASSPTRSASAPRPTTASSASRAQSGVLDELNHNLRIADGVLRFRIFKVDPRLADDRSAAALAHLGRAHPRSAPRTGAPAEAAAEAPSEPEAPGRSSARGPKRARGSGRGSRRGAQRRSPLPRRRTPRRPPRPAPEAAAEEPRGAAGPRAGPPSPPPSAPRLA